MKTLALFFLILSISFPALAAIKESAFDRVMRTQVLRCAYASVGFHIRKNPLTQAVEGPVADIAKAVAESANLKLEWSAEVGYADFADGLQTGRYDAFCGVIAMTPARGRVAAFTMPAFYQPYYVYVPASASAAKEMGDFNRAGIRAGSIDGESYQAVTRKHLPMATEVSLPNMSQSSQLYEDLASGKLDIVIHDPIIGRDYIRDNPGRIRRAFEKPVEVYPMGFAVAPDEQRLVNLMNTALLSLHALGAVDAIFNNYGIDEKTIYRVSKPYEVAQ